MQRWHIIGICLLSSHCASPLYASPVSAKFKMDCGTQQLYMGQTAQCHYWVSSESEILNVEVVKFPEFRGFWSENLALRQGPISLLPISDEGLFGGIQPFSSFFPKENFQGRSIKPKSLRDSSAPLERQALVGTYLVSAMIGKQDARILPMKIKVQSAAGGALGETAVLDSGLFLSSEMPEIRILELPPLPTEYSPTSFTGAVGSFTVSPKEMKVAFHPNEPTNLRITLAGKGNFPELNQLPIQLGDSVELLRQRNYTQGTGNYAAKVFEYSFVVHGKDALKFELGKFVYFDPQAKRYQSITLPTVELLPAPPIQEALNFDAFRLPPPERVPSITTPWNRHLPFWLTQGVLSIVALGRVFQRRRLAKKLAIANSPEFLRAKKWELAQHQDSVGLHEAFLKTAAELTTDLLKQELGNPTPAPHTQRALLALAKDKIPADRIEAAANIFETHSKIYSPTGAEPTGQIRTLLKKLVR